MAVRLKIAALPPNVDWIHMAGVALLGGVRFTVALFMTGLAFESASLIKDAKIGIFIASLIAGILGYCFLFLCAVKPSALASEAAAGHKAVELRSSGLADN